MNININGIRWHVIRVPPNSPYLLDRENIITVATTDPVTRCIYISTKLHGEFERRVMAHEIGHAVCFSYDLLEEIHRYCLPEHWIDMEEFICNFVADYGEEIYMLTNDLTRTQMMLERIIT